MARRRIHLLLAIQILLNPIWTTTTPPRHPPLITHAPTSASWFLCFPQCTFGTPKGYKLEWEYVTLEDRKNATFVTTIVKAGFNGSRITSTRTLPVGVIRLPTDASGTRTTSVTGLDGKVDHVAYPSRWTDYDTLMPWSGQVQVATGYCTNQSVTTATLPPHDKIIDGLAWPDDPEGYGYNPVFLPLDNNWDAARDVLFLLDVRTKCGGQIANTRPNIALQPVTSAFIIDMSASPLSPGKSPNFPSDTLNSGTQFFPPSVRPTPTPPAPSPSPPPSPPPAPPAQALPLSAPETSTAKAQVPVPPASSAAEMAQIIASIIGASKLGPPPAPAQTSPTPSDPNPIIVALTRPSFPGVSLVPTVVSQVIQTTDNDGHVEALTTAIQTFLPVGPGGIPVVTPSNPEIPSAVPGVQSPSVANNFLSSGLPLGVSWSLGLATQVLSTTLAGGIISAYTVLVPTSMLVGPPGAMMPAGGTPGFATQVLSTTPAGGIVSAYTVLMPTSMLVGPSGATMTAGGTPVPGVIETVVTTMGTDGVVKVYTTIITTSVRMSPGAEKTAAGTSGTGSKTVTKGVATVVGTQGGDAVWTNAVITPSSSRPASSATTKLKISLMRFWLCGVACWALSMLC